MDRNSLSARYEADASKVETRWAYGGSSLRIQIHFGTQRIMRCMGESVDGWSGEDSCVSSPKKYKSSPQRYRSSPQKYRSSEDATTSWED